MKWERILLVAVTLALMLSLFPGLNLAQDSAPQSAMGTAFTYQGYLEDQDVPVTGTCQLDFTLYDGPDPGAIPLASDSHSSVQVSGGRFTEKLDFGSGAFDGDERWLEIAADCGGGLETLSPRQELTPTPYALYAATAGSDLMSAAGTATISGSTTSASVAELDRFTVSAPGPGVLTVMVMGSAFLDCDASSSDSRLCTNASIGICDTSASAAACGHIYQHYDAQDPDNSGDENKENWITLVRTVTVSSAGDRIFYLNGSSHEEGMTWRIIGYVWVLWTPASLSLSVASSSQEAEAWDNVER
jgi:hypothetical protein